MSDGSPMRIVAIIPAHMASVRFPGKILHPFFGLPMIEHVRRRALMCSGLSSVIVATCDEKIADAVRSYGGEVVMTSANHKNGTTRVAEVAALVKCTHVILLQGDEPLLLPGHVESIIEAIKENPDGDAWNATGPLESKEDLDRHSFVKCIVSNSGRILLCFRRSPGFSDFSHQQQFIRKILGIIAYRKEFLAQVTSWPASTIEAAEFIEQMRILENDCLMQSVPVTPSLPSVNEPQEAEIVLDYVRSNEVQRGLLEKVLVATIDSA